MLGMTAATGAAPTILVPDCLKHPITDIDVRLIDPNGGVSDAPIWSAHSQVPLPLQRFILGQAPPSFRESVPLRPLAGSAKIQVIVLDREVSHSSEEFPFASGQLSLSSAKPGVVVTERRQYSDVQVFNRRACE
jgi:hypothetical protein